MRRLSISSLLLIGALAGCGQQQSVPGPHATATGDLLYGAVTFKPCALSAPQAPAVEAHCATVTVPENHDEPQGRKISLAVALVMADGQAESDPIVMIAGGPGQSAIESYPLEDRAFSDAHRSRNVLLVDARGTGGSHPLKCSDDRGRSAISDEEGDSPAAARAFAERCRDKLSKDTDLRFYATADAIRDLDFV